MVEKFDGELYLEAFTPPQLSDFENLDEEVANSFELLEIDTQKERKVIYDRVIFKYIDPTSPPHTKKICGKWAKPIPGVKVCVGWTIKKRWLYRIGYIRVTTISDTDASIILEECLKESLIAGILARIISGNEAIIPAAEKVLNECLSKKLKNKLLSVFIQIKSSRGNWE